MAKSRSDPRVTYADVKVQVRDLVRGVGIVAPLPHGGIGTREKLFFIETKGVNGYRRSLPDASSSGAQRERSQATFMDGTRGYSGKIRFIEKSRVQDEGTACG